MTSLPSSCYQESSDLRAFTSFDDMPMFDCDEPNMDLLQGISQYGFEKPSQIQEIGIVPMFERRNLVAQSQSGTGKTGTFVIGSLSIIDPSLKKVQLVVVAPTHELATQIHHVYNHIATPLLGTPADKHVELCVGKQVSVEQNMMNIKNNGVQILVGTPGRILHLVKQSVRGEPLVDPRCVRMLVLDEADKLLSTDSREMVHEIVGCLEREENTLQFGIFSATFNKEATLHEARLLCMPNYRDYYDNNEDWTKDPKAPVQILLKPEKLTLDGIEQYYFDLECDGSQGQAFTAKVNFIDALNQEHMLPTCMIYVNNSSCAEKLKTALNSMDMVCECIYGGLSAKRRIEITDAYRRGEIRILISTDLLARGFDVSQVSLVINFDLPFVFDRRAGDVSEQKLADYLHRIGRSGRFGRKGVAINIIASVGDRSRKGIIEEFYKVQMSELPEMISQIY